MSGAEIRILLLLAALVMALGCNPFHRSRAPDVPAPVSTAPPPAAPRAKAPPKPELVAEPQPELVLEGPPPVTFIAPLPVDVSQPPPPPRSSSQRPRKAAAPKPKSEATASRQQEATSGPVAVPQLTQLLTPEQEWAYNQEIDGRLTRTRQTLEVLRKWSLNEEQMIVLDRIRTFVKQTAETRVTDLVTARSLARRAELLAQDLERSSH